jgi:predicted DNA-binding transcriptional regulator AlpA
MQHKTAPPHLAEVIAEAHEERPTRLLNKPEVLLRLGIGNDTLYRLIKNKELGPPVKIGTASRWPSVEIDAFIAKRIAQRAAPIEPSGPRNWRTKCKAQPRAEGGVS